MRVDLSILRQLAGFQGAAVVDCETGLLLGRVIADDGHDMDPGAAGATDVVRAARALSTAVWAGGDVEDVLVALKGQFHFAKVIEMNPAIIIYLALDRRTANLGMALVTLRKVERNAIS